MFLIAGLNPKLQQMGAADGECPACGARGKLFLVKQSQALTLFFISVFKFGGEYIATCSSCASVMELDKDAGRRAERDPGATLYAAELHVIKNNARPVCPGCGRRVADDHSFCPGCGHKL